jgi:hypothetical protein
MAATGTGFPRSIEFKPLIINHLTTQKGEAGTPPAGREQFGPPPLIKSDFLPQKQSRSSLLIISVDIINNIDYIWPCN